MAPQHGRTATAEMLGVGLRAPHVAEVLATRPSIGWFEVHAENYMQEGPAAERLDAIRRDYPLSLHGVGLSLGSADGLDPGHLDRLARLIDRTAPILVSEHLSWSIAGGVYLNDLLPLPYTEETLAIVADNVDAVQAVLKRPLLVENPSTYLRFRHSAIPEAEFLAALARRTGCRLLCDVNNLHVSCTNLGGDAAAYLQALPSDVVAEIHLAGHCPVERGGRTFLIDDHGDRVAEPVWQLYRQALTRFGAVPSLIEWDKQLPPLKVLIGEARKAARIAKSREAENARLA